MSTKITPDKIADWHKENGDYLIDVEGRIVYPAKHQEERSLLAIINEELFQTDNIVREWCIGHDAATERELLDYIAALLTTKNNLISSMVMRYQGLDTFGNPLEEED